MIKPILLLAFVLTNILSSEYSAYGSSFRLQSLFGKNDTAARIKITLNRVTSNEAYKPNLNYSFPDKTLAQSLIEPPSEALKGIFLPEMMELLEKDIQTIKESHWQGFLRNNAAFWQGSQLSIANEFVFQEYLKELGEANAMFTDSKRITNIYSRWTLTGVTQKDYFSAKFIQDLSEMDRYEVFFIQHYLAYQLLQGIQKARFLVQPFRNSNPYHDLFNRFEYTANLLTVADNRLRESWAIPAPYKDRILEELNLLLDEGNRLQGLSDRLRFHEMHRALAVELNARYPDLLKNTQYEWISYSHASHNYRFSTLQNPVLKAFRKKLGEVQSGSALHHRMDDLTAYLSDMRDLAGHSLDNLDRPKMPADTKGINAIQEKFTFIPFLQEIWAVVRENSKGRDVFLRSLSQRGPGTLGELLHRETILNFLQIDYFDTPLDSPVPLNDQKSALISDQVSDFIKSLQDEGNSDKFTKMRADQIKAACAVSLSISS